MDEKTHKLQNRTSRQRRQEQRTDEASTWGDLACRIDMLHIAALRIDPGLSTAAAMASRLAMPYTTFSRLLNNHSEFYQRKIIARICTLFNAPLTALLDFLPPSDLPGPRALVIPPIQVPDQARPTQDYGIVTCELAQVISIYEAVYEPLPLERLARYTAIPLERLTRLHGNRDRFFLRSDLARLTSFFSRAAAKGTPSTHRFASQLKAAERYPGTAQLLIRYVPPR
jgi:hypothetical protein